MNNDQNMNNIWNIINKLHQEEKPQTHEPMDIRIGIWGGSNSGKTTYLTMLYKELLQSNEWYFYGDPEANTFVLQNLNNYIIKGKFPPPTQTTEEIKIFTYTLRRKISSTAKGPKIVLNFIDAPGKFYEDINSNNVNIIKPSIQSTSEEQEVTQNQTILGIIDYLLSCDGIIFLLDPMRTKEEPDLYWNLLFDLFLKFQERSPQDNMTTGQIQQYMAFCVTKSDRDDIWSQGKKSDDLAKDVMGKDLFKSLKSAFCIEGRYNFFSVASIGRYQNKDGEWKEAVIYPNIQDNSKTETTETTPSPIRRGRGRRTKNNKSQNSQTTDASSEEPTISSNSSSEEDDDWAEFTETSNTADIVPRYIPTINTEVEIQPLNVIAPIEWLINSIEKEPVSRLEPK